MSATGREIDGLGKMVKRFFAKMLSLHFRGTYLFLVVILSVMIRRTIIKDN